jgi:hypothetical protein
MKRFYAWRLRRAYDSIRSLEPRVGFPLAPQLRADLVNETLALMEQEMQEANIPRHLRKRVRKAVAG